MRWAVVLHLRQVLQHQLAQIDFVQQPHRKRPRPNCRVTYFHRVQQLINLFSVLLDKVTGHLLPHELLQFRPLHIAAVLRRGQGQLFGLGRRHRPGRQPLAVAAQRHLKHVQARVEVLNQALAAHVVHYFLGRIERALAFVVFQQVLEYVAQHLRVHGHHLLVGAVFLHREVVRVQKVQKPAPGRVIRVARLVK